MLTRLVLVVLAAAWALPLAGCGNSAGVYPVSGKVLYKGEPAAGAVVYFQKQGELAPAHDLVPFGIVQNDGQFSLVSEGLGDGALPGTYSVLVEWTDKTENGVVPVKGSGASKLVKRVRLHAGPDRLKGRYFNNKKPLLTAEVKPGPNQLEPFELTD